MALQVWLPLTKDLRNQGLSNIQLTSSGNGTVNAAGKLGSCYYLPAGSFLYNNNFSIGTIFSVAMWVKFTNIASSTNSYFITLNNQLSYDEQFMLGIYSADGSTGVWRFNISGDCGNIAINTWYHFCCTYDGTQAKIYINGECLNTFSHTLPNTSAKHLAINGRSSNSSGTSVVGSNNNTYYNDIRIYDHCLSLMEVKELAKGLVLHYPLSDSYIENTINLGNTSATYSNQTAGVAQSASSWGGDAGTITYYYSGGYANYPYKIYHKTATGDGGIFLKTADDINIKANTTYTMSVWIKASRDFYGSPYSFNINRGSDNFYITFGSMIHFTTKWTHLEKTFTTGTDAAGLYGEMSIIYDDGATDYYVYFSGFQIEEKDHVTPWTPDIRNENVIYDCSGFENNGTRTGAFACTSDTPKYTVSTVFNNSNPNYIAKLDYINTNNQWTVSFWYKVTTAPNGWQNFFCLSKGDGSDNLKKMCAALTTNYIWLKFESTSISLPANSLKINAWTHLVLTCDGSVGKVYENGVLLQTSSSVGTIFTDCTNLVVGARVGANNASSFTCYYGGQMSDFRIYATTLSADDIKSLYQNSAYIDSSGNVYGTIHEV